MDKLSLHSATKKLLTAYLKDPTHALCLSGEVGAGLGSLAFTLAADLAGSESLVTVIAPEKDLISIERVRGLYEQTRSVQQGKRCIIIDDADTMSRDAQNALLKLLEEPARNVHFILTTHQPSHLLATIRSRTQIITVLSLGEQDSLKLLEPHGLDETKQRQALFLALGRPAELIRLAENPTYFDDQATIITDARMFLQGSTYDRLVTIKKYSDRSGALYLLAMCTRLLRFNLLKQHHYATAELMPVFEQVIQRIDGNGHVKTHLMYLVTKLP